MIKLNVYSETKLGLDVYVVTINGVQVAQYMSRNAAMAKFIQLRQKYQGLVK